MNSFSLPAPRDASLAGCMWLARIVAKARAIRSGTLPAEYSERFGAANGTDGQFLEFFGITKEQFLVGSSGSDAEEWFLTLPGISAEKIAAWNELAVNLGRPGYPMAERLPVAMRTTYAHLDPAGLTSVFEVIEADERQI